MGDRVALYQRISEDDLGLEKGIARQEDDGRALATSRGWTVVAVLSDNDISALKGAYRPDYEKLLDMARRGEIDRVVVFHTSRLWRNRKERAEGIEIFARAGVSISAVKGTDLDLSSAFGRGMVGLMGEFDTMESEIKGERVARTALQRAQEGRANGAVAYGWQRIYEYDSQGRKVGFRDVEQPDQAAVVREIVRRLLAGDPVQRITDDLNRRGVPAPGAGQNRKHRTQNQDELGSKWNKSSVSKIATRPANVAIRTHGAAQYPAAWPPLISEADHARVKALFAARSVNRELPGQRKHLLTWGDVAVCGVCGSWLRVGVRGNMRYGRKQELYICNAKDHVGRNKQALDDYVRDLVVSFLGQGNVAELLAGGDEAEVSRLLDHIGGLRARQANSADDYASGLITRDQLVRITENIGRQIEAAERELRATAPRVNLGALDGLTGAGAAEAWDALDVARQRQVLEVIGLRLEVHPVTRRGPGFDANSIKHPDDKPFGVR